MRFKQIDDPALHNRSFCIEPVPQPDTVQLDPRNDPITINANSSYCSENYVIR